MRFLFSISVPDGRALRSARASETSVFDRPADIALTLPLIPPFQLADGDPSAAKAAEESSSSSPSSDTGPEGAVPAPDSDTPKSAQPTGEDAPAARSTASNSSPEELKEAEKKDQGGNDPQAGSDPSKKETSVRPFPSFSHSILSCTTH